MAPITPRELGERLAAAQAICEAAGPIALRYFRQPHDVLDKSGGAAFDPVTVADREIEAFVRARLGEKYPSDGIVGEEQGETRGDSGLRWLLDPIDGTRAFMTGMPAWGILLGLCEGEQPRVGLMHQPFLGETFAGDGQRAFLRDRSGERRITTRASKQLGDAVLYCTSPSMFPDPASRSAFDAIAARCKLVRFGGDCYAYCLLAMGQVDLVIEAMLKPYDIAPLIPVIEGAGGVVTSWSGGSAAHGGKVLVAGSRELHAQALALLSPASST